MADFAQAQIGNVTLPLTASTSNTLLKDADPALFYVLDFFVALIRTHLGARWDAEVTAAGLTDLVGKIVNTTMSCDPAYYLLQEQATPPILAMYRLTTEYVQRTRHYSQKIATWGFDWILPPLSAGQGERLLPFRNAVESLLLDRIDRGHDPTYNSDQRVFEVAGITAFRLAGSGQFIRLTPPSNPQINTTFEELHLRFECKETVKPMPQTFPAMEGVSASMSAQNADGTYPDLAKIQVNNP